MVFVLNTVSKKKQLTWSLVGLVMGPLVELMYRQDWWQPRYTFPNFPIHVEDVLFGFCIAGILSSVYEVTILRRIKILSKGEKHTVYGFDLVALSVGVAFISNILFGVHSFYSSAIAMTIFALGVLIKRTDLFAQMVATGLLMVFVMVPFFVVGMIANHAWVQTEWMVENLWDVYLMGVPLQNVIWIFLTGFSMSGFWEMIYGLEAK